MSEVDSPLLEWAERKQYESAVGTILYGAMSTMPEVSFAVNQLARFLSGPREIHWKAMKRVLRYLQGARDLALVFDCSTEREARSDSASMSGQVSSTSGAPELTPRECVAVSAYCDADWGGCVDTRRSTTGFVIRVFGCAVSWMSKKQKTIALSSTEAEYMALSAVIQELQWMHQLLQELGLRCATRSIGAHENEDAIDTVDAVGMMNSTSTSTGSSSSACACLTPVFSDNQSTLTQCCGESDCHARSKHIDIRHHFVKAAVKRGEVGAARRFIHSRPSPSNDCVQRVDVRVKSTRMRRSSCGRSRFRMEKMSR
jgi:hypothetical protein